MHLFLKCQLQCGISTHTDELLTPLYHNLLVYFAFWIFFLCMILKHHALIIWKILIHYVDLPNVDISLHNIPLSPRVSISLPISSEKPLNIELSSSWWQIQVFQNFHLKAQFLSLATCNVSCSPWSEWQAQLIHF